MCKTEVKITAMQRRGSPCFVALLSRDLVSLGVAPSADNQCRLFYCLLFCAFALEQRGDPPKIKAAYGLRTDPR